MPHRTPVTCTTRLARPALARPILARAILGRRALVLGLAAALAGGRALQAQTLDDPAAAPPAAPRLGGAPPASQPGNAAQAAPPIVISGLRNLPQGGWRLRFEPGADAPSALQRLGLQRLGGLLARETTGRVTLWAEVAAGEDVSATRRLALGRALAVRAALATGGLPETRVDIRALGRTEAALDVVDILPFGARRD